VRFRGKVLNALVTANNGFEIGNVTGANIDTKTWHVTNLTLNLKWQAAHALDIPFTHYPGGVHHSPACLPVPFIASYEHGILKINKNLGQISCKNGIIECKA
jgi:hypothetical protein